MRLWPRILLSLAAIWLLAGIALWAIRAAKPTPASVAAMMQPDRLAGKSPSERSAQIDRAAKALNQLSFEERGQLRHDREQEKFFRALTPEEQGRFLDATLPSGFKQLMESFNRMDAQKRKQFVERAVQEMQKHEGESGPGPKMEDPNGQRIVGQGLKSFYNDASAETKLDMAPLIEQMQKASFPR